MSANREYKDSVFSLYLSEPERLIEVYNAVANTDYPPDTPVVVLIEHQSTINENMALRLFLYSARVYEKITKQKPLYKRKRVKIPVPRFIVLYNGNEPYPEYGQQKLSDSFIFQQENPQLELKIDIYNINYEMNAEIVKKSKSLAEYSRFIGLIKANLADGLVLEGAIKHAIEYGMEHDIMSEFLEAHGSEVANMLLSGWNMDEALAVSKEEGYEDGFEDGEQKKQQEMIRKFSKINTPEQIAEILQVSVEYVLHILNGSSMVCETETPYIAQTKEK